MIANHAPAAKTHASPAREPTHASACWRAALAQLATDEVLHPSAPETFSVRIGNITLGAQALGDSSDTPWLATATCGVLNPRVAAEAVCTYLLGLNLGLLGTTRAAFGLNEQMDCQLTTWLGPMLPGDGALSGHLLGMLEMVRTLLAPAATAGPAGMNGSPSVASLSRSFSESPRGSPLDEMGEFTGPLVRAFAEIGADPAACDRAIASAQLVAPDGNYGFAWDAARCELVVLCDAGAAPTSARGLRAALRTSHLLMCAAAASVVIADTRCMLAMRLPLQGLRSEAIATCLRHLASLRRGLVPTWSPAAAPAAVTH